MIDIISVVFREELPILQTQAQSIDLYCQNIGIKNIYVLVNDEDALVNEIDVAWWGSLQNRVRVLPRSVFSCEFDDNGWLSQQLTKLLATTISYNTWAMVLDAKTVFVKHLDLAQMFTPAGALNCGWGPMIPVFRPAQDIANRLFCVDNQASLLPSGVPFFFNTNEVRKMISHVTEITGESFPQWFQAQGMLTEFVLYSTWIRRQYGDANTLYSGQAMPWLSPVNICHSETGRFDQILDTVDQNTLTLSVHRNAWIALTDQQRQRFRNILLERRLTSAENL